MAGAISKRGSSREACRRSAIAVIQPPWRYAPSPRGGIRPSGGRAGSCELHRATRRTQALLVVARLAHLAIGSVLARLQRRIDRALARQRRTHLLPHRDTDRLELRDRRELHADVRALRQRAVVRVRGIDRGLLGGRELGGLLEI